MPPVCPADVPSDGEDGASATHCEDSPAKAEKVEGESNNVGRVYFLYASPFGGCLV